MDEKHPTYTCPRCGSTDGYPAQCDGCGRAACDLCLDPTSWNDMLCWDCLAAVFPNTKTKN